MLGNVWEWTASDFNKESKSVRGASFNLSVASDLRAASRYRVVPVSRNYGLGFRCVREVIS